MMLLNSNDAYKIRYDYIHEEGEGYLISVSERPFSPYISCDKVFFKLPISFSKLAILPWLVCSLLKR